MVVESEVELLRCTKWGSAMASERRDVGGQEECQGCDGIRECQNNDAVDCMRTFPESLKHALMHAYGTPLTSTLTLTLTTDINVFVNFVIELVGVSDAVDQHCKGDCMARKWTEFWGPSM